MLKKMGVFGLVFLGVSLSVGAVDEGCLASDGTFLKIRGCCNGVKYEARPKNPKWVNPYEMYSFCCAGQIVDEFDVKKYKCCREGSLRGQVVALNQSCQ